LQLTVVFIRWAAWAAEQISGNLQQLHSREGNRGVGKGLGETVYVEQYLIRDAPSITTASKNS